MRSGVARGAAPGARMSEPLPPPSRRVAAPRRWRASRCAICAAGSRACASSCSASRSAWRRSSRVNSLARALARRAGARRPDDPRRRRVVLADAPRTRSRGARVPRRAAARCRPSPRCARWRATTPARRRSSRSRRSTTPGRGSARRFSSPRWRRARRWREARRPLRRGGRGGAARPARPQDRRRLRSRRGALRDPRRSWSPSRTASPTGIGLGPRALISQDALARERPDPARARWCAGRRACCSTPAARRRRGGGRRRFVDEAKAAFPEAGWEARTRSNVSPDFSRDLDRFGEFLALVGLISLVVGGVGVANAAQGFVERKRATLAILKALGASGGAVVALALVEFLAVALIGVGAGLAIGAATPFAVAALFAPRPAAAARAGDLPERTRARRALRPADGVRLRRRAAGARPRRPGVAAVPQPRRGAIRRGRACAIVAAAALGGAALAGAAVARQPAAHGRDRRRRRDGARASRRCASSRSARWRWRAGRRAPRPVAWRMAIANLHRPGALTAFGRPVARARPGGAGRADAGRRPICAAQLRRAAPGETPSFYFLDVRSAEVAAFRRFLALEAPQAKIVEAPMMRGRIVQDRRRPRGRLQGQGKRRLGSRRRSRRHFRRRAARGVAKSSPAAGGTPTTADRRWCRWRRASPKGSA